MGRPRKLAWKSLGASPLVLAAIFVAVAAAIGALSIAGGEGPQRIPDGVLAGLVTAVLVTIAASMVLRRRRWRQLQRIAVPLDIDGYVAALGTSADRAHLVVELNFAGTPPTPEDLDRALAGFGGGTLTGSCATLTSPRVRASHPVIQGRFTTPNYSNRPLDAWFRRLTRGGLVPLHHTHPLASVRVEVVRDH